MTVRAFVGGAGCGKTHSLMQAVEEHLQSSPLKDGQKALALTFMHGSRRRLEERLGANKLLKGRAECLTLDGFAWRLVRRWRALAAELGFVSPEPNDYEQIIEAAGALLCNEYVRGWVTAVYPILIVDEAQDLSPTRLRLIQSLSSGLSAFVAADEFQCLNQELRPNPACEWITAFCEVTVLTEPRRTSNQELIQAATSVRRGEPPVSGKMFQIVHTAKPALAGAWLNGCLRWYCGGKSVAVITPTVEGFARAALDWASSNTSKKGAGPYFVRWEDSDASRVAALKDVILQEEVGSLELVTARALATGDHRLARDLVEWTENQRRALGKKTISKAELTRAIERALARRRRLRQDSAQSWSAMSVHGAKNREFNNVVVLWPAAVGGDQEQKRRLLYNAITRAKERCLVLVQAKKSLQLSPFA
jgi:superfamily I DNA/RNA helicase